MRASHLITCVIGILIGLFVSKSLPSRQTSTVADPPSNTPRQDPQAPKTAAAPPESKSTKALLKDPDNLGQIDASRLEELVERRSGSRESLIAAALLTRDHSFLRSAAEKYPDDPHVQFLVIANDVFPDKKTEWVDRFKASQPDNSLASILKGGDLFENGDTEAALEQLNLAARQAEFENFSTQGMLTMESGLIDLGESHLEAKMKSTFAISIPELPLVRNALKQLHPLAENAATPEEKAEIATLGLALGNQFSEGSGNTTLINRLVGLKIESQFLDMLEPDFSSPNLSATPAEMLKEIQGEREAISTALGDNFDVQSLQSLSEAQLSHYLDRLRSQGELDAIRWFKSQLE